MPFALLKKEKPVPSCMHLENPIQRADLSWSDPYCTDMSVFILARANNNKSRSSWKDKGMLAVCKFTRSHVIFTVACHHRILSVDAALLSVVMFKVFNLCKLKTTFLEEAPFII